MFLMDVLLSSRAELDIAREHLVADLDPLATGRWATRAGSRARELISLVVAMTLALAAGAEIPAETFEQAALWH